MTSKLKDLGFAALITIIPTLLIWLPFFLKIDSIWGIPLPQNGMATIVSNYDGPLYIVAAKTMYDPQAIKQMFEIPLPVEYYAAHFPLFPGLIRIFSGILGYPYSMLFVTVITSILATYAFMRFIAKYVDKKNVYWIALFFAVFPARWLIVRSIGSPEPLFLAGIISSVYFFQKEKYFLAGLFGMLAQLTKSPGILLFVAYLTVILIWEFKNISTLKLGKWIKTTQIFKYWPIIMIPLGLVLVFVFYSYRLNDFWAYFHSGDNIHLLFPPFQIFNYSFPWVGTFWLEEVIFIYLIGLLGLMRLIKNKYDVLYWFTGIFLASLFFVTHRDLARYMLPIIPFLYVAFKEIAESREFKITLLILAIPIYLFSITYISQNTMPISNWSPFL